MYTYSYQQVGSLQYGRVYPNGETVAPNKPAVVWPGRAAEIALALVLMGADASFSLELDICWLYDSQSVPLALAGGGTSSHTRQGSLERWQKV